jgi:hypothetical protein
MVICDLGGAAPEDEPNPNVMYELGIRHAFGHPVVIMGWRGQRLPFDIANQRVIMENRRLLDIEVNISKIVEHITSAERGDYYRPMDAVARTAVLDNLSTDLVSRDTVLQELVDEISSLKATLGLASAAKKASGTQTHLRQAYHAVGSDSRRETVKLILAARGLNKQEIGGALTQTLPVDLLPTARTWDEDTWADYLEHRLKGTPFDARRSHESKASSAIEVSVPAQEAPPTDQEDTAPASGECAGLLSPTSPGVNGSLADASA